MSDQKGTTSQVSAKVKISTSGSDGATPISPAEFLKYLHANGFKGNAGINENYSGVGVIWMEFRNSI